MKYLEALGDADPRYANEPLTDADRAAIAGSYAFGPGPTERLVVTTGERGPAIQRESGTPRFMLHLGGRMFHPPGAEAVRIQFSAGERSATLTIADGPLVVTGRRSQRFHSSRGHAGSPLPAQVGIPCEGDMCSCQRLGLQ